MNTPMTRIFLILSSCALATGVACDKKERDDPAATSLAPDTNDENTGATKEVEPAKDAPAELNDALMADIKKVASACEIDVKYHNVKCTGDEYKALRSSFTKKTYDRVEVIDTMATALTDSDPKVQSVAANMTYSVISGFPDAKIGDVPTGSARRMLETFGKLDDPAQRAMAYTVYVGTLAGLNDEVYTAIEKHPRPSINPYAFEHVMKYGRLTAFPKIQELAKSEDEKTMRVAFNSVLNMNKMSDEEKNEVCPWAKGYLSSEKDAQFLGAGRVMLRCRGEYINDLLAEGEKRNKENKFTRDYTMVYRDICFSMVKGLIDEAGVQAQCERNYKLLEDVTNNEETDSTARGLALFGIYYQRRDQKSYDLMKKYKDHKDEKVKKYANESMASLEKHYLKKK